MGHWHAGHLRLLRVGLSIVGVASFIRDLSRGTPGYDAFAYWTVDLGRLYRFTGITDDFGAFRYSPVVAQAVHPFGSIPFEWFYVGLLVLLLGALVVLGRGWGLALLLIPPVASSLHLGNIDVLLGLALAFAIRYPLLLALPLLTKVTPGVGILWFALRREWRGLAMAVLGTAAICSISFVTTPALWSDWVRSLAVLGPGSYGSLPIIPRIVGAAAVVAWGACTERPWSLVIAGFIAVPGLDWKTSAMLVGLLPVLHRVLSARGVARSALSAPDPVAS
jgi:Glycosyltransferase family 87